MSGAFIAIADDATAASWNPGGLVQLERPEVSLVLAYNNRREDTTFKAFPEASGPQDTSTIELNLFKVVEEDLMLEVLSVQLDTSLAKIAKGTGSLQKEQRVTLALAKQ